MTQLKKSFRLAFWCWPWPGAVASAFWMFYCCAYFLHNGTFKGILAFTLGFFLFPRMALFIDDFAQNRWPQHFEKQAAFSFRFWIILWLVSFAFSIDWRSVAQMRPDWQGALSVLAMVAVAVCFFGPLMWLLDYVFKPFARRTGQHFLGALGFIAICGLWWSGLVLGLLMFSGKSWW